ASPSTEEILPAGEDEPVHEYAVTILGRDRPGIIAQATRILAGLRLNLTDSTMTRLRGHFAMTLICAGEPATDDVDAALAPMRMDLSLLVTVRELGPEPGAEPPGG